jgi:aquaporin Z
MFRALKLHWPDYLMESLGLGLFMIAACGSATLLEYPGSPVHQAIGNPMARRALMGLAMGLTGIALIYSPWGPRSGAHLNPSVSLAFLRLGRVPAWDAAFYTLAQFIGGAIGVWLMSRLLGAALAHPAVNYVVTMPGRPGPGIAFAAETAISLGLMLTVLVVSSTARLSRLTGMFAGALVALWVLFEAPISGTSMNPARTFGSDAIAGTWHSLWLYLAAPPLGMLAAAEVYKRTLEPRLRARGAFRAMPSASMASGASIPSFPMRAPVLCAKLDHPAEVRCIFCEERVRLRTGHRVRSFLVRDPDGHLMEFIES